MDDVSLPTFDRDRAAQYDDQIRRIAPGYDVLHDALLYVMAHALPERAHILVAGAGTGAEIVRMGQHRPGWRFTAVDPSAEMLARCREHVAAAALKDRVQYRSCTVEDLDETDRFDAATSIFVAHFIDGLENKRPYFRAIAERLLPEAPLVVADLVGDRADASFAPLFAAWRAHYKGSDVSKEEVDRSFDYIDRSISFIGEAALQALLHDVGFGPLARFYQCYLWGAWFTRMDPQPTPSQGTTD